jgi:plasmid stabilization system protein ParE
LTIRISNDAAEDLSAAARYLSERNPRAAADLVAEVLDLFARLDERASSKDRSNACEGAC